MNVADVYLLTPLNTSAPTAEDKQHSEELEQVRLCVAATPAHVCCCYARWQPVTVLPVPCSFFKPLGYTRA